MRKFIFRKTGHIVGKEENHIITFQSVSTLSLVALPNGITPHMPAH